MKIRPVGTEFSMRTEGRTDMTKLIVAFHNFANSVEGGGEEKYENKLNSCFVYLLFLFSSLHDSKESIETSTN